jgi:hypothetical protein
MIYFPKQNPVDRVHQSRGPVVQGGIRATAAKGLAGAHAGWHFWAPNLTARGPKGGGLLRESHRKVGWWWGARDLAGDETLKQRRNKLP